MQWTLIIEKFNNEGDLPLNLKQTREWLKLAKT